MERLSQNLFHFVFFDAVTVNVRLTSFGIQQIANLLRALVAGFEDGHKGVLRDFDAADLLHALLPFLLDVYKRQGGESLVIVLSTDTFQEQFWQQTEMLRKLGARVVRLYE